MIEAVPAATVGSLAVALEIRRAVVGGDVVFTGT
jgi:hypothetical protein